MTAVILPIHSNTCRNCGGMSSPDGTTCRACNDSRVIRADAAMREHWGYGWGYRDHARRDVLKLTQDDSPYSRGTFADRCWRAGWQRAERDEVAESHREKLANERSYPC